MPSVPFFAGLVACAAPVLTVSPPHLPAAGTAVYGVTVQGGPADVVLWVDGVEIEEQDLDLSGEFHLDTTQLADGAHQVVLETRGFLQETARHAMTLVVDNTAPTVRLAASSSTVGQGHTLGIFAQASERVSDAQVTFLETTWDLEKLSDHVLRAVKGMPVGAEPGSLPLTLHLVDDAGNETTASWTVTVTETAFPKGGYVRLSSSKKKDMGKAMLTQRANEARWQAYRQDVGLPLVDGLFQMPTQGRVTSHFGKVRRYNTGDVRHHLGTDLKGSTGSVVVAAHDGLVTLAEELHIYGNAVILKHGPNVSTSYNHLSQITVDVGQDVTQGMMIGRVGSTGQSTGPHLHWGMEVGGTAVAAEEWTTRDFSQPLPGDFEPGVAPDPTLDPPSG